MHELHLIEVDLHIAHYVSCSFWLHALPSCCQNRFYGWVATSISILFPSKGGYAIEVRFRVIFLIEIGVHCFFALRNPRPAITAFHFILKPSLRMANVDWQTLILLSTIQPEVEISINVSNSPATCSSVRPYSDCRAARENINRNDKFISKFPCFGCAAINSGLKSTRKHDKFRTENSVICWVAGML